VTFLLYSTGKGSSGSTSTQNSFGPITLSMDFRDSYNTVCHLSLQKLGQKIGNLILLFGTRLITPRQMLIKMWGWGVDHVILD